MPRRTNLRFSSAPVTDSFGEQLYGGVAEVSSPKQKGFAEKDCCFKEI